MAKRAAEATKTLHNFRKYPFLISSSVNHKISPVIIQHPKQTNIVPKSEPDFTFS